MSVEKQAIRQRLRARRRDLASPWVAQVGEAVRQRVHTLLAQTNPSALIAYVAHENEVPTAGILEDAVQANLPVYLPARGARVVVLRADQTWERGPGGVMLPLGPHVEAVERPCVALVPLVAWNPAGVRVGRGAGYYDQLFAHLPADIVRVGLAYEFQEVADLPRDPWDVSLHFVITEQRTVRCGAGPSGGRFTEEEIKTHDPG